MFTTRANCIICNLKDFDTYFQNDVTTSLSLNMFDDINKNSIFVPYNILSCKNCKTVQLKYIGDIETIYQKNHVDHYGLIKTNMHSKFSEFILSNPTTGGIIEVGACTDELAKNILSEISTKYTVIDANFQNIHGSNIIIKNTFFESCDISSLDDNTLIMSHVFEHFYNPIEILKKIQDNENIKYLYVNHPNLEYYCKQNVHNILNIEHSFYIENDFLIKLFKRYGFESKRIVSYETHSIFIEFHRCESMDNHIKLINNESIIDSHSYFSNIAKSVSMLETILSNDEYKYYIWPASAHSIALFTGGLTYSKFSGILDNSPNKIGKILYGFNLKCYSFRETLNIKSDKICIILSNAGAYCDEIINSYKNIKFIKVSDI
jgi:hypothetical protein